MGPRTRRRHSLWRVCASMALALGLSMGAGERDARADEDPWFGPDKALHFSVSAGLSSITYGVAATQYDARYPPLLWGAGVSLTLGVGKELYDLTGRGDPSWKDLTWDVLGTAAGLLLAWSIDLVVRGVSPRHPLLASPSPAMP